MSDETKEGNNPGGLHGSTDDPARRRIGLSPRGERILNSGGIAFLVLFSLGWVWSIGHARAAANRGELVPTPGGTVGAALTFGWRSM